MSESIPDNISFDEFLVTVNARDIKDGNIVPEPDVAARLTQEIEKRTGLTSANLSGQKVFEEKGWISATPGQFVMETQVALATVCRLLAQQKAKSFDVAFHNRQDHLNWGDKVLFAVRYDRIA